MTLGQSASLTDPGRRRRRNEDAFVSEPPIFAVADGMGGAQAGEVASRLAAAAVREKARARPREDGKEHVRRLVQEANRRVYQRSSEDQTASGMGTTMTVAVVGDGVVTVGHVGDSRAYLIRDGRIEQLTEDHSLVNELMKTGKLSREEAETHPQRSVITRALETDPDVDVDTFSVPVQSGDVFLLCSDGLTDMLSEDGILRVLERHRGDIDRALRALVKEANRGGGEDNITVVAFEIADAAVHDGETREQALPAELAESRDPDEEDTLTEADRVPAVDTMVLSTEEIRAQVAAQEALDGAGERREPRRWPIVVALIVVALALVVLVLWRLAE